MPNDDKAIEKQPVDEQPFTPTKDWFLSDLVQVCNNTSSSYGITLFMNGLIITGDLISGKEYFELLSDLLSSPEFNASDLFLKEKEFYSTEQVQGTQTTYIHLKNARSIVGNGQELPSNGCLWRGQLSHVSGFCFGTFSVNSNN